MELIDGLIRYKTDNRKYYDWALQLEAKGRTFFSLLQEYDPYPPEQFMVRGRQFLVDIEGWKAGCYNLRMGLAIQNSERKVWDAFREMYKAPDDLSAIQSIMALKGFGSAVDDETGQKRAKVATSVMRFFWPDRWGVVDWRSAAMLGLLRKNGWDVDCALSKARKVLGSEFQSIYDLIDENAAYEIVEDYRVISSQNRELLPRAADVDMALFGLSLIAWS